MYQSCCLLHQLNRKWSLHLRKCPIISSGLSEITRFTIFCQQRCHLHIPKFFNSTLGIKYRVCRSNWTHITVHSGCNLKAQRNLAFQFIIELTSYPRKQLLRCLRDTMNLQSWPESQCPEGISQDRSNIYYCKPLVPSHRKIFKAVKILKLR